MIIKGNRADSIFLRWLFKKIASSDEARPVLTSVKVKADRLIAADGFKLAVVQRPEVLSEIDNGTLIKPINNIPAGKFIAELEEVEGKFPAWEAIMPTSDPKFTITLSPKLLTDILSGCHNEVKLAFHSSTTPIEISSKDVNGDPIYALLMPIHQINDEIERPEK